MYEDDFGSKFYASRPTFVRAFKFDGSQKMAEAICKRWPEHFVISDTPPELSGLLFIKYKEMLFQVSKFDIVFRSLTNEDFCALPENDFFEGFEEYAEDDLCAGCTNPEVTQ